MISYYKYSVGEVFEFRHEPNKYWMAMVIYSFDQLHLFKWLGGYGEFWHDSTIEREEDDKKISSREWSRSLATKQLFDPGYHMRFTLESQYTLERPTTFLITPSTYEPENDPYGSITTVDDLLALDSTTTTSDQVSDHRLLDISIENCELTEPPTSNFIIKEKINNIINAVILELESQKLQNQNKPPKDNCMVRKCTNLLENIVRKPDSNVPISHDIHNHVEPTTLMPKTQICPNQDEKSTISDTIMEVEETNSTCNNNSSEINAKDDNSGNGFNNLISSLECLGIDFEERKRQLLSQHQKAMEKGCKVSLDDWAKMNCNDITVKLYNYITTNPSPNYIEVKDLCRIIQIQAQFDVYQSPLGELVVLVSNRETSNDHFDLSILNDENKIQIEYDKLVNGGSELVRIYFNHKCFTGPSLSKSKICSLPQYVGPGPMSLVIEEVVTKVISVAYVPPRILNDLSSQTFIDLLIARGLNNTTMMEFKAKYQKRIHREAIPVCLSPGDLASYCECLCEHLKCCYNLFGPNLYDGDDCPGHCRALTKSNKFMKRATYYREKARNGEFLGNDSSVNKKQAMDGHSGSGSGNNSIPVKQEEQQQNDKNGDSPSNFRQNL